MTPLTTKYQPRTLEDFAGLRAPKAILSKLAESPYQSAWILVGPAGTGKTTMAYAFASAIGAQVHHIASRSCTLEAVEDLCRSCSYVPMFGGNSWHCAIVDEADQMTAAAQLAFLSKLDSTEFPPQTIFVFTCNETEKLEARFLSRCRMLEFTAPPVSLLTPALAAVWSKEADGRQAPDFARIIRQSQGNFRDALNRLELALLADDEPEAQPQTGAIGLMESQVESVPFELTQPPPAPGTPEWWKAQRVSA